MGKTLRFAPKGVPFEERFWAKVVRSDEGCWFWTGATVNGYGRVNVNGKSEIAARVAWRLTYGEIPEGHVIRHLCNNGASGCVRPDHLRPGTAFENSADTRATGRLHRPHYPRPPKTKKTRVRVVRTIGPDMADWFWERVKPVDASENACWEWQPLGHRLIYGRKRYTIYRVAYELTHGPIPKGEGYHGNSVCHTCDNRRCVRPDHLFLGTHKDNMRDMYVKGRNAGASPKCRRGHPRTPENTYRKPNGRNSCRVCRRLVDLRAKRKVAGTPLDAPVRGWGSYNKETGKSPMLGITDEQ